MDYNLVTNLETCYTDIPSILYYSHIPTAVIALAIGLFVFWKNKRSLMSKLLLFIAVSFFLWSVSDLVIWTNADSRKVMFLWSWINLIEMLVSLSTLYFAYVFLEKKDAPFKSKIFFGSLLTAFIIFIPSKLNLLGFDYNNCESTQGPLINYYYVLEAFFSLFLIVYLIRKIKNSSKGEERKKTIYLSLGVIFFLLSFSGTNIYSSITTQWQVLQYGLFGMVVFMGFLAFLIVRYKAFDIKLIGAQALVVAQFILIGSMFFFAKSLTNQILTVITLVITSGAGWFLVQSVKKEVERKEQLQKISDALVIANQRLKELDLTKSEFISIASHQLRTPLTAIKGYISLLLEGSYGVVSAPVLDILNKLYSVNNRLVHLVEDLLNVSRIEAGRIQYSFAPTQLEPIITELVDMFKPSAKEKNLTLTMKLQKTPLPLITIDPNKIKEVVSNLIDNAVKYTKEGGVTVSLESTSDMARITVSDTGIGIHDEDKKNLFQKFLRSKETTKMVVSGAGLGLYVGKSFIEAHGGKIWAESDGPDKGSRFIIELPLKNTKIHIGTSDEPSHSEKA